MPMAVGFVRSVYSYYIETITRAVSHLLTFTLFQLYVKRQSTDFPHLTMRPAVSCQTGLALLSGLVCHISFWYKPKLVKYESRKTNPL